MTRGHLRTSSGNISASSSRRSWRSRVSKALSRNDSSPSSGPPPALPRRPSIGSMTCRRPSTRFPPAGSICGPKKPKDACYVGHARFCGEECYVWVCADGVGRLSDFTRRRAEAQFDVQGRAGHHRAHRDPVLPSPHEYAALRRCSAMVLVCGGETGTGETGTFLNLAQVRRFGQGIFAAYGHDHRHGAIQASRWADDQIRGIRFQYDRPPTARWLRGWQLAAGSAPGAARAR